MLDRWGLMALACYTMLIVLMSFVSFVLYGFDKRRATFGGRRIRERTLHAVALFGGWPGAFIAQRQFRHKTRKSSFQLVFWCVLAVHVLAVASLALTIYSLG